MLRTYGSAKAENGYITPAETSKYRSQKEPTSCPNEGAYIALYRHVFGIPKEELRYDPRTVHLGNLLDVFQKAGDLVICLSAIFVLLN